MQVGNVLHATGWKCRMQKIAKKSPSAHHRTTLFGYIFATKARIDNRKKNLLRSNISSRCPYNMVNFGLLTAEIRWRVWQGCSLGLDVSVSRRSRDVVSKRLGLVSVSRKHGKVSILSRTENQMSRSRLGLVETWEGLGLDLVSD